MSKEDALYIAVEEVLWPWTMWGPDGDFNEGLDTTNPLGILAILEEYWEYSYGSMEYDESLLKIATGGWSYNEFIVSILKRTIFWSAYWKASTQGGTYYFDVKGGNLEWGVTKKAILGRLKYGDLSTYPYSLSSTALKAFSAKYNRAERQVLWLYQLCRGDDTKLEALEEAIKKKNIFRCPDDYIEVRKILQQ